MGCAGDPAEEKKAERWCSTQVDAQGKHMDGTGHFGFCAPTCPSHYHIQIPDVPATEKIPDVSVTPHGVTAVPAITRKPKALSQPNLQKAGKF